MKYLDVIYIDGLVQDASQQHTNIDSDNGLSLVRRQAIFWTNAAILSIRLQRT